MRSMVEGYPGRNRALLPDAGYPSTALRAVPPPAGEDFGNPRDVKVDPPYGSRGGTARNAMRLPV